MSDSRNESRFLRAAMPLGGYLRLGDRCRARVLLLEPPACPEEGALDRRAGHAHLRRDLAVGEALELAQHEDAVMVLRELGEGAAQVVEALLVEHRLLGPGVRRAYEPQVVGRSQD